MVSGVLANVSQQLDVFDDLMYMLSSDTIVGFIESIRQGGSWRIAAQVQRLGYLPGKFSICFFQFITNKTYYVRIPGGIRANTI